MLILYVMEFAPFPILLFFSELLLQKVNSIFQSFYKVSYASVLLDCIVLLDTVLMHIVRIFIKILKNCENEAIKAIEFEDVKSYLVLRDLLLEEIIHEFVLP